jgi:hypothetical protein
MTRRLLLALAAVALVAWPTVSRAPVTPALAAPARDLAQLDALMMDLNIAPLDPVAAPALTVTTLEGGGRVSLTDVKGRAVLVYFWATW